MLYDEKTRIMFCPKFAEKLMQLENSLWELEISIIKIVSCSFFFSSVWRREEGKNNRITLDHSNALSVGNQCFYFRFIASIAQYHLLGSCFFCYLCFGEEMIYFFFIDFADNHKLHWILHIFMKQFETKATICASLQTVAFFSSLSTLFRTTTVLLRVSVVKFVINLIYYNEKIWTNSSCLSCCFFFNVYRRRLFIIQ